jgi:hypothetical protein
VHRAKQDCEAIFAFAIAAGKCKHNPAAGVRRALAPKPKTAHFAAVTEPSSSLTTPIRLTMETLSRSQMSWRHWTSTGANGGPDTKRTLNVKRSTPKMPQPSGSG